LEDDAGARKALVALLAGAGWDVVAAGSVAEALAALRAPGANPSCAVLDLNLPDGDSRAVLRRIRAGNLPVRVAVATASEDAAMLADVSRLGPDAFYRKPLDMAAVREWLA
jgi:two-component system OmpR family response regulator